MIDVGQTVDVTVRGTAGAAVDLLLGNARLPQFRVIRTATIGTSGSFTWTGLRPEDTSNLIARPVGTDPLLDGPSASVRVRRTVTIGIQQPARGIYVFTGQIARAEAGVQVTIARLDDQTKRVTGVASTRTTADGRYEIRTSLPQGLAGYYALTEARNGLDAGRSRLYGLLVNTQLVQSDPRERDDVAAQDLTLDVRSAGRAYSFTGRLSPARGGVPVTLAQVVGSRLQGLAGGVTGADGRYVITIQPPPGTYQLTALTAGTRSRNYGLVVPAAPVRTVVSAQAVPPRPADVDCPDFSTQRAAQAFHDRYFPDYGESARLDEGGRPGVACESLP